MEYFRTEIPSIFLPDKACTWDDHGLVVFPSRKNKAGNNITLDNTLMTVVVFSHESLTGAQIISTIRNLVTFLAFFGHDYYPVRWLLHQFWGDMEKRIRKTESLSRIISSNIEKVLKRPSFVYRNYQWTHVAFREKDFFNFKDLAHRYFSLRENERLREQIDLMAFSWMSPAILSNFYNNANLDISLTFTLIDSVIKESGIMEGEVKSCVNCGYETRGKKGDRKRIKDFVKTLDLSPEHQELYEKIILNIYQIRNTFFHEGASVSVQQNVKRAMTVDSLEQQSGTIYQEADHGQSRFLGVFNLRVFLTAFLISKLEGRVFFKKK